MGFSHDGTIYTCFPKGIECHALVCVALYAASNRHTSPDVVENYMLYIRRLVKTVEEYRMLMFGCIFDSQLTFPCVSWSIA